MQGGGGGPPDGPAKDLLRAATELDHAWSAEHFAPSLSAPLLELALEHYDLLDARVKVRFLLAAGCLRLSEQKVLEAPLTKMVTLALGESEQGEGSWVRMMARIIGKHLTTLSLHQSPHVFSKDCIDLYWFAFSGVQFRNQRTHIRFSRGSEDPILASHPLVTHRISSEPRSPVNSFVIAKGF